MRVEYLLLCKGDWTLDELEESDDLTDLAGFQGFVLRALKKTYSLSGLSRSELESVLSIYFEKICGQHPDGEQLSLRKLVLVPEILPEDERQFLEDFHAQLRDERILHCVKFYDDHLKRISRNYADEIFDIEMQLREALTFMVWMDNPFNPSAIFENNNVEIFKQALEEKRNGEWKDALQNEFFYHLFTQYPKLNERKSINGEALRNAIFASSDFAELQCRLSGALIAEEKFKGLLAQLKDLVKPVEAVRNCAAHNSHVSQSKEESYERGKQKLLDALEEFMREQT